MCQKVPPIDSSVKSVSLAKVIWFKCIKNLPGVASTLCILIHKAQANKLRPIMWSFAF